MLGAHPPAWGVQGAQHAPAPTQAHATGDMKPPEPERGHLLLVYFSGLRFQGQPELPRQNIRLTIFFQYHWMALRDPSKLGSMGCGKVTFFICAIFLGAKQNKNYEL